MKTKQSSEGQSVVERPEAWDTLLTNALELARDNYKREIDRNRFITDKAKVTYTIAGLTGAVGISRIPDALPIILRSSNPWIRIAEFGLAISCGVLIILAILITLRVMLTREYEAPSDPQKYVETVHTRDKDAMNRALEGIYQSCAKSSSSINTHLAADVNRALKLATAGFILAILFFGVYAYLVGSDQVRQIKASAINTPYTQVKVQPTMANHRSPSISTGNRPSKPGL